MKVKLVVAHGVHAGKEILVAGAEFAIGRDPQCQLRPSSPAISKKHCAIVIRGNKVFVRDFGSTNGTFVNDIPVKDEIEVTDKTQLKVGPLAFMIVIEVTAPPKPVPAGQASGDDDFAAFLLEGDVPGGAKIPEGSTVMEMKSVPSDGTAPPGEEGEKKAGKPEDKKPTADTQSAAADILKLYQRRPRS